MSPYTPMTPPGGGRSYRARRRVRLGDVTPLRQVRLDAVARYLHDIAADDVRDAGIAGQAAWVVRRTTLEIVERPRYEEEIDLVTWCSGTGAAWAERRTIVSVGARVAIEGSSLWVCLDPGTLRPQPIDDRFFAVYGEGARSRAVSGRLRLPRQPPDEAEATSWALRRSDTDVLGHVNNAIAFAAIEQEVARMVPDALIDRVEVEYRQPVDDGHELRVVSERGVDGAHVWLFDGSGTAAIVSALRLDGVQDDACD